MTFGFIAFAVAWRFLAPDSPQIVAMEWKRVLDSPLSAAVRREIPPAAAPVLASVNFIEGISHAVWTPGLVVLEGSFDLERLKDMAAFRWWIRQAVPQYGTAGPCGRRRDIRRTGQLISGAARFGSKRESRYRPI